MPLTFSLASVKPVAKPRLELASVWVDLAPSPRPDVMQAYVTARATDGREFTTRTTIPRGALTKITADFWANVAEDGLASLTSALRPRYRFAIASKPKRAKVRPPHSQRPAHKRRVYG